MFRCYKYKSHILQQPFISILYMRSPALCPGIPDIGP